MTTRAPIIEEDLDQAIEPTDDHVWELIAAVLEAHHESVFRNNVSSAAVQNCAVGSGELTKAVASAILSVGGLHAPLVQTARLLKNPDAHKEAALMLERGEKVPGFGCSFTDGEDPLWTKVSDLIREYFPDMQRKIDRIKGVLHMAGKKIQPNAACFTAAAGIISGMDEEIIPMLFIKGRLDGWGTLFMASLKR